MSYTIFISHSESDCDLARAIIELISGFFEVDNDLIRCTSVKEHGLSAGSDVISTIQSDISNATVVIGIITGRGIRSPWVLCELGAAWGKSGSLIPCLAGISIDEVRGPIGGANCLRLCNSDEVHDIIKELDIRTSKNLTRRNIGRARETGLIENVVRLAINRRPLMPDYSNENLYSLHFSSSELVDDTTIFQDFDISRSARSDNVNAVHFMWADTYAGSTINGQILCEEDKHFLSVDFNNVIRKFDGRKIAKGWASNIKIKPINDAAFDNLGENGALKFKQVSFFARSSGIKMLGKRELETAALSVRLLDRRLTYWNYAETLRGGTPTQFMLSSDWARYTIDLEGAGYQIFDADGNQTIVSTDEMGRPIPDFTVFAGIVFVVGSHTAGFEEPGLGKGVIDIGKIELH